MNLIIDTGNTFTKVGVFDRDILVENYKIEQLSKEFLSDILLRFSISDSIHSFVAERDKHIDIILNQHCRHIIFSHNTNVPVTVCYKTPTTLGLDRLAAIVGASTIFPKTTVLVIDAGSAITFDLLSENAEFIGGNISPGISMRFKALHTFTDKLPLLQPNSNFETFGTSTDQAIIAGVQRGIIAEIESYILQMEQEYSNFKVIFTGGDTFFFDKTIKKYIFAEPYLVLKGLNRIIQYNV